MIPKQNQITKKLIPLAPKEFGVSLTGGNPPTDANIHIDVKCNHVLGESFTLFRQANGITCTSYQIEISTHSGTYKALLKAIKDGIRIRIKGLTITNPKNQAITGQIFIGGSIFNAKSHQVKEKPWILEFPDIEFELTKQFYIKSYVHGNQTQKFSFHVCAIQQPLP